MNRPGAVRCPTAAHMLQHNVGDRGVFEPMGKRTTPVLINSC